MRSARQLLWLGGAPIRQLLLGGIVLYRVTLSGWLGGQCRFYPSCSRYAEEAIRIHGALRGSLLATRRLSRCHPFGRGGLDPVPARVRRGASGRCSGSAYDGAIHRHAVGGKDAR
jgi:putative membrane protein insertion efficiency factor